MAEKETERLKGPEAQVSAFYEYNRSEREQWRQRAQTGQVVIRGKELNYQQSRQGRSRWYLHPLRRETALQGWMLFQQDIRTHSGRHRHQGGLAIYVLEGKGWTMVDGVRHDWEEGDLILLPIKPHGVEHQHFNADPGQPCKWLAMIYRHFAEAMFSELEQKEASPDWSGQG